MIRTDGWSAYNIWENSSTVRELYGRRAKGDAEEMTCAAQAAELLGEVAEPGDTLLDAGCGTGYFYHSIAARQIPVEYYGIDPTTEFIETGRKELKAFGLPTDRLQVARIDELAGRVDHVLCMNVLSNIDNFHRPLERLLRVARKSVILRESIRDEPDYRYVVDAYLDPEEPLRVHVNAYGRKQVVGLANEIGFDVREVTDLRTGGEPEDVIGYPHYWTFMVFRRRTEY